MAQEVAAQQGAQQKARVTVTKDGMHAMLVIYPPAPGEEATTLVDISGALERVGVIYGIDHDIIAKSLRDKSYNTPIAAARGTAPIKGLDSQFTYSFDIANNHSPHEDADGRVDYKSINFIQNAEPDQVLATRTLPTDGTPGTNVMGKPIAAGAGRDIKFRNGSNTKISDDGMSLIAITKGAICYRNGEVSVRDVTTINQDIDATTGNIECRGSVKVHGDIKAGFSITADGDVEVSGLAEDCTIKAHGNIMVKGGFFGSGAGMMQADGNITVKFAEGQKLISGADITIGGELVHCNVIARGSVFVSGKKGKIVGGEIRAGKEVKAAVVGSEAATPTNLYVAFNAELMGKYYEITKELNRLKADSARVKEALYGLYRLQMDGKLKPDKAEILAKFEAFQKELPKNLETLETQKTELEEKMKEYRDARIIVEDLLYPGVKAHFGLIYREVTEEVRACKLTFEGTQILMSSLHKS